MKEGETVDIGGMREVILEQGLVCSQSGKTEEEHRKKSSH